MKQKHGLLFFISSCIPGCGQMHQGFMKRGLSLMLMLCFIMTLAAFLHLDYLVIFLVPLWLYSFFDSYNLRALTDLDTAPEDSYLFGVNSMDSERLAALCRKRHSFIGWGLILLGVYILFDTYVGRLMSAICDWTGNWWYYDLVMRDLPRTVVTIFIIALGIWFIRGPKSVPTEEIPVFTPPAEPAQSEDAPAAEQEVPHDEA